MPFEIKNMTYLCISNALKIKTNKIRQKSNE